MAAALEAESPARLKDLASFEPGDAADLEARLAAILALGGEDRDVIRAAARRAAVRRWSWRSVAAALLELRTAHAGRVDRAGEQEGRPRRGVRARSPARGP